jgi:16S rRNA (adenine1518-N6/adenine1519-N6)-dimethyltransferase
MSRQKLGQHFLSSPAWRERIARTLPADANATWIEIGPGHGEMTEFLAQHSRHVIAIETDSALASTLRQRAAQSWPNVEIIESDILAVDLAKLVNGSATADLRKGTAFYPACLDRGREERRAAAPTAALTSGPLGSEDSLHVRESASVRKGTALAVPNTDLLVAPSGAEVGRSVRASESKSRAESFRVYGNLPYYITSPILSHLFRFVDQIDSIHIVIQLEVAERIAATPGHREYAYLSALCQYFTRPEIIFRIPPGAFRPPPKVTSALLAMNLPGERAQLRIRNDATFLKFLQSCFSQKRKTLRNNLKELFADATIAAALAACNLTPKSRAEEISLAQFAELYHLLTPEK